MKRHEIWMLIGCVLPLLLVFVVPLLGINTGLGVFFAVLVMFVIHISMLTIGSRSSSRPRDSNQRGTSSENKEEPHESHQH